MPKKAVTYKSSGVDIDSKTPVFSELFDESAIEPIKLQINIKKTILIINTHFGILSTPIS